MKGRITLTQKEQARAKVVTMVIEGRCSAQEASELLGLSRRHVFRLKKGLREDGPAALAHGNRGRRPAHAIEEELRREVLRLAGCYHDYNHSHLQEVLEEEHGLTLSRRSVARILTASGLRSPRRRRSRRHRARRERLAQEGMMLQVDGSRHDWLEGRGPRLTLIGAVDDASGDIPFAVFREDAQGYLTLLRETVRRRGVPLAWYSDRHGIFRRNDKEPWTLAEELAARREPTQVGRALEALGINLILANSPQAKGRVERCWGVLQDRLVKDLRRANACTLVEANKVLRRFLPRYRERFKRAAADQALAYRPLPLEVDLDGVCSFHYARTVANDNIVRLEERSLQVPPGPGGRSYAGCRVQIQERLDGSLAVLYQGQIIAKQRPQSKAPLRARRRHRGRELPARPILQGKSDPPSKHPTPAHQLPPAAPWKPAPDHPWRRSSIKTMVTKSLAT